MRINSIAYHPISYTQRYEIPLHQGDNYAPVMPAINVPPDELELETGQIVTCKYTLLNRSKTCYCRGDVDWQELGEYLKENYDIKNTDFYCFGCSTGEEAYTLAILLKHIFKDIPKGKKIHASDIAKSRIDHAKNLKNSGFIDRYGETGRFRRVMGMSYDECDKYFSSRRTYKRKKMYGRYEDIPIDRTYISNDISNIIDFRVKNILNSVDEFSEKRPSVIFARNMWPYIKPEEYQIFADKLYNKLAPGSMIMIGHFDYDGEDEVPGSDTFPMALKNAGFEPVPRGTNYRPEDEKEENHLIFIKQAD